MSTHGNLLGTFKASERNQRALMLSTVSGRSTILLAVLLLLVAPAKAEPSDDAVASADVEAGAASAAATDELAASMTVGNLTMNAEGSTEDTEHCQLVDYSLSKPTAITPDPDRCFIPYILSHIPV